METVLCPKNIYNFFLSLLHYLFWSGSDIGTLSMCASSCFENQVQGYQNLLHTL